MLNLRQAAAHAHIDANELRHVAQRGEIEFSEHGGDLWFEHRALDEWAQRSLLAAGRREQVRRHMDILDEHRRSNTQDWRISPLFRTGGICLDIRAKAKAGMIRDMTDLAERTGLVYDTDLLFKELVAREEIASTAVGEGAAFLYPRFHDPFMFEESFVAYGRSARPVFFGAPNGEGTRHFFLVCSTDHEMHLHILSRLAVMTHATGFLERLAEVEDPDAAVSAIRDAEEELLG